MNSIFMREKVIHSGTGFLYPEIYPYTGQQAKAVGRPRRKKTNVSAPKQKNLNARRAIRYFVQLVNANFGQGDLVAHLTYSPEFVPGSAEEADACVNRFLRRLAYYRKKHGLEPLRYVCVTQVGRKRNGTHRLHHHVFLNGGVDRDVVESMWWAVKGSKEREPVPYGWANVDRLRPGKNGVEAMARYMVRDSAGKRRWTQSKNLVKPWYREPVDGKYSRRQMEKVGRLPVDSEAFRTFWEKKYKGWELVGAEKSYQEEMGWYFYLTMRRRP